jgi:hypothetical protein
LSRRTTALAFGAALQPLFATGGLSVRLTAGTLLVAASKFCRTAVLRFLVGGGFSEQESEGEEGAGKQFRKHGKFSSECRFENQRSLHSRWAQYDGRETEKQIGERESGATRRSAAPNALENVLP